jgi:hypothetical protein
MPFGIASAFLATTSRIIRSRIITMGLHISIHFTGCSFYFLNQ